ncbi:methyltransferase domain-containing protein [Oleiagrimonas soli]|uniref:SAM-dependent methyltransferase n=1 Tax=Oleiagrimonas soli TaxID=1543381 RepID=A0A099D0S0_9GAMM|nr:methyltransferase domain-containing protein [Oleiagrimonas soli]KGI78890.1 hypothetical protein LF63_0102915 [Oleiagrimonas soli]MBB6184303.1 SAM-dependent methyltransferase [Oleiagrimonas soli]
MTIEQDSTAYMPGFRFYDDNLRLLHAALEQMIRRTRNLQHFSMLSLGVGHRVTVHGLIERLGDRLRDYLIVEGSESIIEMFRRETPVPPYVRLEQSYFETFETDRRFDVIEMGFVLEHVADPGLVLRRFSTMLAQQGRIMIAVPNAHSLHRKIGFQAGLMPDVHALSEADRALGHQHYFDPVSIQALIESCGLEVVGRAGLMLKPFTSDQLASLKLDDAIVQAMDEVGFELPDVCNGIFLEARACQ